MKKSVKKYLASTLALVMVLATVFSFAVNVKAASEFWPDAPVSGTILNVSDDYSGILDFTYVSESWGTSLQSDYLNYDYAYQAGQKFNVSFTVYGASDFQQAAVQFSGDNWGWQQSSAKYVTGGIQDGYEYEGILEANHDIPEYDPEVDPYPPYLTFKIQFDQISDVNLWPFYEAGAQIEINNFTVTPVVGIGDPIPYPDDQILELDTNYYGTFYAENEGTEEAPAATWGAFANVNTNVEVGDKLNVTYKIVAGGDTESFQQIALQSPIDNWAFAGQWYQDGIVPPQLISKTFTVSAANVAPTLIKIVHLDNAIAPFAGTADTALVAFEDLVITKVPAA
ncbi:MAG: hypothetical protein LBR68_02310 [Lachnoclostridium sp.]|jgi:hypothetical protein|nr:hypothetical protein [Lachnoclostridium sp.]